jgi:hypothetical protein
MACSKHRVITAFTVASTVSIRSMCAAITSRAETSRRRSISASVIASLSHRAVTGEA